MIWTILIAWILIVGFMLFVLYKGKKFYEQNTQIYQDSYQIQDENQEPKKYISAGGHYQLSVHWREWNKNNNLNTNQNGLSRNDSDW